MRITFALTSLALLATTLFAPARALAVTSLDPEIARLEKTLEDKIQTHIKDYYGSEVKVLVNVRVIKGKPLESGKTGTTNVDVGYVPLPINLDRIAVNEAEKELPIQGVEVDLAVPDNMDEKGIGVVKSIAERVVKSYNPAITITKLPAKPLDKPIETERYRDQLLKPETVMRFASILLAAVFVTIGIALLASAAKNAAKAIAEGFQSIRTSNQNTTNKPIQVDINTNPLEEGGKPAAVEDKGAPTVADYRNHSRNLKLIKQILATKPILFLQAFEDTPTDLAALKSLLPNLEDSEQEALRKTIGDERLSKLNVAPDSPDALPSISTEAFVTWLTTFVERIMVLKVQGGSPLEKMLGPDKTLRLFTADSNQLIAAVRAVDDRAAWRIAVEFLPVHTAEAQLRTIENEKWHVILDAAQVTDTEVHATADRLFEMLDQAPGASREAEDRMKYFSDSLLEVVVGVMVEKRLDELDPFMDMLEADSPEFARMLHESVWTPRSLDKVPDDYLVRTVKAISTDEKVALIVALPPEQSERIRKMVPQGNVSIIVNDNVRKAKARNDAKDLENYARITREFLDYLRSQVKAGQLQLLGEGDGGETETRRVVAEAPSAPPSETDAIATDAPIEVSEAISVDLPEDKDAA